ncbi:MAG: DUF3341 domain-containing protein [Bacteroidetes bacterium]|nr:DUF3341 domain-containing protein [Bacteroidota bacterium]
MDKRYLLGIYDDDHTLLDAIKNIRGAGMNIHDVLTPFPVHGIEDALGFKKSRIPTAGFFLGACGTATALGGMSWVFTSDWPLNFGGKPFFSLPAFIPITFELTVLFAVIGMFMVFLISSNLAPGKFKPILYERATDDRFVVVFDMEETDKQKATDMLNQNGAIEVQEKLVN